MTRDTFEYLRNQRDFALAGLDHVGAEIERLRADLRHAESLWSHYRNQLTEADAAMSADEIECLN